MFQTILREPIQYLVLGILTSTLTGLLAVSCTFGEERANRSGFAERFGESSDHHAGSNQFCSCPLPLDYPDADLVDVYPCAENACSGVIVAESLRSDEIYIVTVNTSGASCTLNPDDLPDSALGSNGPESVVLSLPGRTPNAECRRSEPLLIGHSGFAIATSPFGWASCLDDIVRAVRAALANADDVSDTIKTTTRGGDVTITIVRRGGRVIEDADQNLVAISSAVRSMSKWRRLSRQKLSEYALQFLDRSQRLLDDHDYCTIADKIRQKSPAEFNRLQDLEGIVDRSISNHGHVRNEDALADALAEGWPLIKKLWPSGCNGVVLPK